LPQSDRIAGVESQQRPSRRPSQLRVHDPVLTGSQDVPHDPIDRARAEDGAGGRKVVHRGDYLFGYAMHLDEHDSVHGALARRKFLVASEFCPTECLDHLRVLGEAQLRGLLKTYAVSYNDLCTHLSLDKDASNFRRPQRGGRILAITDSRWATSTLCSGLTF
jgi:hypothetical protein